LSVVSRLRPLLEHQLMASPGKRPLPRRSFVAVSDRTVHWRSVICLTFGNPRISLCMVRRSNWAIFV
jgi:hypothetical protein